MGVNNTCGGIEVARKPERLEEFRRRMTSAKAWGIDAELLTPDEVKKLVPFVNDRRSSSAASTRRASRCVDSLQAGTLFRERADRAGALQMFANIEVLDDRGRERGADARRSSPTRAASSASTW